MTYKLSIYADKYGNHYTAVSTDQAGQRGIAESRVRTVGGRPVVHAGNWYASQTPYRPFRHAVVRAGEEAAEIPEGFRIVPLHDEDPIAFHGSYKDAIEEARERNADVFVGDECIWENPEAEG